MDGLQEDTGDGGMLCTEHPFKNNTPAGGICAFCLQEKLGKLVSSSFPIAVFPSSASSSPSFRSDIGSAATAATTTTSATVGPPRVNINSTSSFGSNTNNDCRYHHSNRSRMLYLLGGQRKNKKKDLVDGGGSGGGVHGNKNVVFKRSKSTAYGDGLNVNSGGHKGGSFWSFLYLQKHSHSSSSGRKTLRGISSNSMRASATSPFPNIQRSETTIVVEENESPCQATFDRKVSRSRSVGCGSRSFSGDFFERISTGFGDCTLRRVESHREGKPKVSVMRGGNGGQDCIQERVRCGGLFSGFMITSSSSSSSSSSNWVASNNNNNPNEGNATGKVTSAHSRSKSWGWALASPMRVFSKPSSSSSKREASKKNQTPNLAAIPSLLSVGS